MFWNFYLRKYFFAFFDDFLFTFYDNIVKIKKKKRMNSTNMTFLIWEMNLSKERGRISQLGINELR